MYKIHYVRTMFPGRSYKLIFQGLYNNPNVELCGLGDCEYVFYHDQAHVPGLGYSRYGKDRNATLVFIDYSDPPDITFPIFEYSLYFKRSWPVCEDGKRRQPNRPSNHFPISYAIMDEFIMEDDLERDIDFGCFLRVNDDPRKAKILEFAETVKAKNKHIGEINQAKRKTYDKDYLKTLKRTKIVLSCNPMNWEGDSRTWETLANGALLFVDKLHTPLKHPLEDGKHLIFYDPDNLDDLKVKLDYYINNQAEAEKIAKCGQDYAMKHHRTINRIDHILEIIDNEI